LKARFPNTIYTGRLMWFPEEKIVPWYTPPL
jgi:hypothetical protein